MHYTFHYLKIWSFSTLPRVELPGAEYHIWSIVWMYCDFQYPTSGRTAWSRPGRGGGGASLRSLSVPYLGSNCLERS